MGVLIPVGALLLVAFAGYIKGAPLIAAIPGDITLIGASIVAATIAHRIIGDRLRPPRGSQYLALLGATFVVGLPIGTMASTNYGGRKSLELLILALLLSTGGAMVILQGHRERRMWVWLNVALGLVVLAIAVVFPNVYVAASDRLAIDGGNTINAGRATGAALVALLILAITGGRRRVLALVTAGVLAGATFYVGSRGPLVAAFVAVVAVVALSGGRGRRGWRILLGGLAIIVAIYMALRLDLVADRVFSTADGSANARRELWNESLNLISDHPLGIGWGNLYYHLPAGVVLRKAGEEQYSHNVLLEVGVEGGWLALLMLIVVLSLAFARQRRNAVTPTEMAMFGLLVFHTVNAMVSSDAAGNRGMWVAIGAALLLPRHEAPESPAIDETPSESRLVRRTKRFGVRSPNPGPAVALRKSEHQPRAGAADNTHPLRTAP